MIVSSGLVNHRYLAIMRTECHAAENDAICGVLCYERHLDSIELEVVRCSDGMEKRECSPSIDGSCDFLSGFHVAK